MSFELVTLKSDGEVLAPRRDRLHRLDIMALRYLRLQHATSGLRAMEWFAGGRLLHQYVHRVFWRLSRQIGLRQEGDRDGPRVHDLRHRFAVQTLINWHRAGEDVERELPVLSTFLGHANVRATYWYLSAAPELMNRRTAIG